MTNTKPDAAPLTRAGEGAVVGNGGDRIVNYIFSTPAVARDGHTIQAWKLDNFLRNPVFLWAHEGTEPPIARVVDITENKGILTGSVEYATAEQNPFADMVYKLVVGRFINATSVSWIPLEWKYSTDRSRPGGVDFQLAELLEISQVPVPSLPTALATARSEGIDTGPLFNWAERVLDGGGMIMVPRTELELLRREAKMPAARRAAKAEDWKCAADTGLTVDDKAEWDGPAATERMLDAAGFNGDSPDAAKAAKGFLAYDAANPTLKGSYKLPFADIVEGKLVAVAAGVSAAKGRLDQADIPKAVADEAGTVIAGYEKKMNPDGRSAKIGRRGLYEVAWLASMLGDLGYIKDMVEWEAAIEEDGSEVPAQLVAALQSLGATLVAMTIEEVNELLAGEDDDADADFIDMSPRKVLLGLARAFRSSALRFVVKTDKPIPADAAKRLSATLEDWRKKPGGVLVLDAGMQLDVISSRNAPQLQRAGKVLSSANEKTLRDAHGMISQGCDMVRDFVNAAAAVADENVSDDPDADTDTERAAEAVKLRKRKAAALKRKFSLAA